MKLDRLVDVARSEAPAWDDARAAKVLGSTLRAHERRALRRKIVRRATAAASAAAMVFVLLLRGATGAAPATARPAATGDAADVPELLAAAASTDGGYGRD
jgi:hypothetical protein